MAGNGKQKVIQIDFDELLEYASISGKITTKLESLQQLSMEMFELMLRAYEGTAAEEMMTFYSSFMMHANRLLEFHKTSAKHLLYIAEEVKEKEELFASQMRYGGLGKRGGGR